MYIVPKALCNQLIVPIPYKWGKTMNTPTTARTWEKEEILKLPGCFLAILV